MKQILTTLAEAYLDSALDAKEKGSMEDYNTYMDCYHKILERL